MSRNLKLFLGAAAVFYVVGAVNDARGMYVLAAASLSVVLACYSLTRLLIRGVTPQVQLRGTRVWAGDEIPVTASVRNAGAITRSGMSLGLRVANETVPEGGRDYRFALPPLPPRSRTEIELALDCDFRGAHRLTAVEVIATDPLGMYDRRKPFDDAGAFLALPRIYEGSGLSGWELVSGEGRRSARMLRASGGELQGVRAHAPGDDLRQVHWKASAHTGELMVKQYQRRREAEIAVWLDLLEENHPGCGPESPTEVAISLVATLLHILTQSDCLVSLAGHGLSPDLCLPSRGEAYLDRALVALAKARPTQGPSFAAFCQERARRSPRLRNVFAVTPAADPGLVDALMSPVQRGAQMVLLLAGGRAETDEKPAELSAAAHRRMVTSLRARGISAAQAASFEDIPRAIGAVAGDGEGWAAAS